MLRVGGGVTCLSLYCAWEGAWALTFRKPMGTSFLLQSRSRAEVFCLRKSFQTNTQEYLFN
ncbi:13544_t:CDS:2 [Funneliformis mosseae]|uniref:13544_t:CDS:1 n=1 Tax=Funneliformis mosseae TaxID=27381 RepID=A0A9N9A567_FUNMO|nr:13544_t:CDS:2 [Funneliformis mosseae]